MQNIVHNKKKIHVCFVSLQAYHFFNDGGHTPTGIGYQGLSTIATSLNPSQFQVSIVTEDCGQAEKEYKHNVTLYASVNLQSRNIPRNIYRLVRALHRAHSDIYVASVFGKDVFFTWLFCKIYRKKFIYLTAHDYECTGSVAQQSPVTTKLFHIALEHADTLIVILESHKRLLQLHHPSISCPIVHIPYAMEQPRQPIQEKRYITWIGRCQPIKNPLLFLTLVEALPNYQFLMIAAPGKEQMPLFQKITRESQKYENLTFIPGVPNTEVQRHYNAATVLVNTSESEGFPFAFIESGIGQTPILSLHANPDDVITTYGIGYYAHGSMQTLTDQLRHILTNHEDWQQKSDNIAHYVQKYHSLRNVSLAWAEVLTSTIRRTPSSI